jgi:hypothetical protein
MKLEVFSWHANPRLVRRGGRDIKKNVAQPPLKERPGWSLTRHVTVSKHPVCAASVGFATFCYRRSHPSSRGGINAHDPIDLDVRS